jgi:hypothetical protein
VKLAVCTPVWGRFDLALPWWHAVDRLRASWQAAGFDVEIVIGGSEPVHRQHCDTFGGVWVETPNRPLGRKWNNTMEAAFDGGAEYVMVLGADDFLAPPLADAYIDAIDNGYRYIGLRGIYFAELSSGRTCFWPGYPRGHWRYREPIGAGRMLHRSLLEDGRPWDDDREKGLDRSMTRKLQLPRAALIPVGAQQVAVDVKTPENIWDFDRVASTSREISVDPPELDGLPEWAELRALRATGVAA